jgi:SAM-dependent methyltransferase
MTDLVHKNREIYDRIWAQLPIPEHQQWPIWGELEKELSPSARLLELGSGVLPRIPVRGGYFADLSQAALRKLEQHGGLAVRSAGPLPFSDGAFQVVCAFEVLEHIPDDETVLRELARVLRPGGALFFSVPVDPDLFTGFDTACGHVRRYQASELADRLAALGLHIERWTTQRNRFRPRLGDWLGRFLQFIERWPRVTMRLKRWAIAHEMSLRYSWRNSDILESHQDGGLIAIARRR